MKYIGIGLIWLGYAGAVAAVAFGINDPETIWSIGILGAVCATVSTIIVCYCRWRLNSMSSAG